MSTERKLTPYEVDLDNVGSMVTLRYSLGEADIARWDNADLLGGDVAATVGLHRQGDRFILDIEVDGTVRTVCDRCLDPLDMHICERYGAVLYPSADPQAYTEPEASELEAGSRDLLPFDIQTRMIDLEPLLADTIVLGLPLRKVHEEGLCNLSMEEVLSTHLSTGTATLGAAMTADLRSALEQATINKQQSNNLEK